MPELVTEGRRALGSRAASAHAGLASVGFTVPEQEVPTAAIAARLGLAEGWIESRTGVRSRHVAAGGQLLPELAAAAAHNALEAAGLEALEVDLVLVATMSHEQLTPSAAALVAARIGAERAGALDVNAACSGFVSALGLAAAQIESGRAGSVLVIGADILSRLTDRDDRATAGLFGDGAGAVVMRRSDRGGRIGPVVLGADGANGDLVRAEREEALIRMNGPDTFRHAVARLSEATLEALDAAGRGLDEVDVFVYHQANSRIISAVGERLGLAPERVIDCLERYGNTSAASVPIAIAEAERRGMLASGSTLLLAAFGGGLTWAATVVDWGLGDG